MLFHRVRPLLDELREEQVPVRLLKGAALASLVYPDAGCRPMRDIDLLVPAGRALEVFHRLESRGWKSQYFRPRAMSERFLRFRHAMDFAAPAGGFIDLHWHVLHLYCHEKADALFWSDSEKFEFCGIEAETCGATGHLLQICTHGIVWSPVPPVRWVADAVMLLRSGRAVDWKILVNACAEWDIVPFALHALAFLRGRFGAAIPEWVPDELSRARVSSATQAEFQRECAPAAPRTAWADLLSLYARWRRSLGGASPVLHGGRLPPPPAVRFRTRESVGTARPARADRRCADSGESPRHELGRRRSSRTASTLAFTVRRSRPSRRAVSS